MEILILLLVVAGVGYYLYRKFKNTNIVKEERDQIQAEIEKVKDQL